MSFSVDVGSKAKGVAKGNHEARFEEGALVLQKRSKTETISIPVGTPAQCDDKGMIHLTYQDVPITIRVLGVTIDNKAMGNDLAAYLNGQQAAPQVDNYKVPGYLIAMACLPLLVPIVTLGGAIPGSIGAMLAFSCLILAKKNTMPIDNGLRARFIFLSSAKRR